MLPAFKASFEVANYAPSLEYLNEGGFIAEFSAKPFYMINWQAMEAIILLFVLNF